MDDEDYRLFERSLTSATTQHRGGALDDALLALGWHDALSTDPRAAISLLFGLQGASNTTSSALGFVLGHALGLEGGPQSGVVLPAIGQWDPPGTVEGGDLVVSGLGPASLSGHERLLIVASQGDHTTVLSVPTSSLTLRVVDGMDPGLSLLQVTGHTSQARPYAGAPAGTWAAAVALGRLAIAHELVGVSRTMLDLACEHARNRIQFGRPISLFQAIRHRLAEARVGIDMADAMIDAAWLDPSPATAAMAKSVAGRQARTAARHCQQVLAGIGFTTEHPLHLFIRRTLVLDALLGSATSLTTALGTEVIRTSQLPPLLPL